MARLRLQPQRVEEIQQALAHAGYLDRDANGKWDSATRDAMLRYQTDHGFPATGLPEAKTLMKLGLGPHPLPEELDPSVAARASVEEPQKAAPQGSGSANGSGADAPRH
jgi:peptidoglycan hydrolase-like protein with peptidoglycan-binding domain